MAGSIEKRGKDKYRLTVSIGSGENRKRYRRTVECKTKTQAEKELAKFVAEIEGDNFIEPSKVTFEAFTKKWLKNYTRDLAPKTAYNYERYLITQILPFFGKMKLSDIKPVHLLEFYNYLRDDYKKKDGTPLSTNTIYKYHKLLKLMFKTAVNWELISSNPADKVNPPKYKKPKTDFYNEEEIKQLLIALQGEPTKYVAAVMVTMAGGFRLGELMGLRWEDIDFKNNIISINQSSQYLPEKGTFTKDPKNDSSIRKVSMPKSAMDTLKRHETDEKKKMLALGELWEGGDFEANFIFTQKNGKQMHPDTPSKWFAKFIKRKGLKKITFHQLRHTSATMLINSGINIKALSARLGHSDTSTTLNIYSHQLKSVDKIAAEKMEKIMFENEKKNAK